MPRPPHPRWFHYPNNTWWEEQMVKLLNTQFLPDSSYFFTCTSKRSCSSTVCAN
jgi:hypothetical protein